MPKTRPAYTPEQRADFIKTVKARYKAGEKINDVCDDLGISRGSYDNWIHGRVGKPGIWAKKKPAVPAEAPKRTYTKRQPQVIKQLDLNDLPSVPAPSNSQLTVAIVKGSPDDVRAALSGLLG